jgi:hypothetical protein
MKMSVITLFTTPRYKEPKKKNVWIKAQRKELQIVNDSDTLNNKEQAKPNDVCIGINNRSKKTN